MPRNEKLDPERAAQETLERFDINRIPVLVKRVAELLGAEVRYSPLDDELSGMIYVKDRAPIIGVNALHHPNRQRFTIAHEIGHLVLHRELVTETVHVDKEFRVGMGALRRDSISALGVEKIEVQANQFAAALLVPRGFVEQALDAQSFDIDDEKPLKELARKFGVSDQMLEYRISNL